MYPAILVTFSPSKRFGWRLRAKLVSDTLFIPWDDNLTCEQNYTQAAKSLINSLGLDWCYIGGAVAVSEYVFVRAHDELTAEEKQCVILQKNRKYVDEKET